ncbi:MAG TPA: hypothetical protein VJX67_03155, partial [Blastocatellia bacterium]|nr:hypothetical protein [Blastocatellia bacterium]
MNARTLRISVRVLSIAVLPAIVILAARPGATAWNRAQDQPQSKHSHPAKRTPAQAKRGLAVRPTGVVTLPSTSRRWALIVGIDRYD